MLSVRKLLAHTALASCLCALRPDVANLTQPPGRMNALPARTLWVWERPEDLSSLNPRTTAIATLDRTLFLGRTITVVPRLQSYVCVRGRYKYVRDSFTQAVEQEGVHWLDRPLEPNLLRDGVDIFADLAQVGRPT